MAHMEVAFDGAVGAWQATRSRDDAVASDDDRAIVERVLAMEKGADEGRGDPCVYGYAGSDDVIQLSFSLDNDESPSPVLRELFDGGADGINGCLCGIPTPAAQSFWPEPEPSKSFQSGTQLGQEKDD